MQTASILFGALFTGITSIACGKLLFRLLGIKRLYRGEETLLAFAAGSACLSLIVLLLSAAGLANRIAFLLAGLVLVGLSARYIRDRGPSLPGIPRLYAVIAVLCFLVFGFIYATNSVAPEASPDGSSYHLGIVEQYFRAGRIHPIPDDMYASLSLGMEMLFLFAWAFGRHSAAATTHLLFLFALPLAMLLYGRRFGAVRAAVAGGLLVFLSPVVGVDGVSAYNDVALAFTAFSLFYLLQIWIETPEDGMPAVAGVLAGFCFALKYTGFVAILYAVALVAWKARRAKPVLAVAACAALLVAPWVVKNLIFTGNPVAPFFNRWFPNPYVHVWFEEDYTWHMRRYDLSSPLELPLEATVRGQKLAGFIGPLFLLSPLALISCRYPLGRRLLLAGAVFLSTYPFNIGTRFLIPALPFIAFALALALERTRLLPVMIAAHAILAWPDAMNEYAPSVWHIEKIPYKAALRIESEEEYLSRRLVGYNAVQLIEKHTPPGTTVFAFSPMPESYTSRHIRVGFLSAANELIRDILLMPLVSDHPPQLQHTFTFPVRSAGRIRVVQTASGPNIWSITEMRILRGGHEIQRSGWRITAEPNPWDVRLALDRSPVTRWRTWQRQEPGMYFEVAFPEARQIDSVVIEASSDQWYTKMRLEALTGSEGWHTISAEPTFAKLAVPDNIRRLASREAKARGIDYVLMFDYDYGFADMRDRTSEWGFTLAGELGNARLYRID